MDRLFSITAILEGISYILLLFIAVPIKYMMDDPSYVKMLGMPHGILFIAYVILVFLLKDRYDWTWKTTGILWALSLIPFGTFFIRRFM